MFLVKYLFSILYTRLEEVNRKKKSDLDLDEIEARCVIANKRSVRLLHRLDFEETEHVPPGPGRGEFEDRMLPERYVFLLRRDKWV